jgi:hypothetical protein
VRVKLDENIPYDAVAVFIDGGHDVHTIPDEDLVGHPDADLWKACVAERRMLVTFDLGFGDIRAYPPTTHSANVVSVRKCADLRRPSLLAAQPHQAVGDHDQMAGERVEVVVGQEPAQHVGHHIRPLVREA